VATSSNTSTQDVSESVPIIPPPSRSRAKKANGRTLHSKELTFSEPESSTRYWSEYDHPEDGNEEDAYVIYIDPDASAFPGADAIKSFIRKVTGFFQPKKQLDEEAGLLAHQHTGLSSTSESESESSDDDTTSFLRQRHARAYGTLSTDPHEPHKNHWLPNFFSITPHPAGNAHLSQPPALLAAQLRHAQAERTKFLLSVVSLSAALVLLIIIVILSVTGRRKLRGEVDVGISFGLAADLLFLCVGVACVLSRRDKIGVGEAVTYAVIVAGICLGDGWLMGTLFLAW
jgi:hypothetical protein